MTVRDACVPLIDLIRELIADSESEWASDQRIQDALDANRDELRYHPLRKIETRASGGAISYLTFVATCGHWDEGVVLVDGNYDSLTPTSSDYMVGRWEFATEPTGPRVYITGYTYDVYATAADLLRAVRNSRKKTNPQAFQCLTDRSTIKKAADAAPWSLPRLTGANSGLNLPSLFGAICMQVDYQLRGVNRVRNQLRRLAANSPRIVDNELGKWARMVRGILKATRYPPPPPRSKYIRTGRLANSWSAGRERMGVWSIRNSASYSGYVVGDAKGNGQAYMHKGRWWIGRNIIEDHVPELRRSIVEALADG